ncbi:hypothetical protein WKT22_05330 [Candidatus Lokiarchaeum ossiferum]
MILLLGIGLNIGNICEKWESPQTQAEYTQYDSLPESQDEFTVLYCHFESTLTSNSELVGTTNKDWEYITSNFLAGSTSVRLFGQNRNHIRWNYGKTLSEGTIECLFHPTSLGSLPSAFYILQTSDYYDGSMGVYHRQDGRLFAQHVSAGETITTIESAEKLIVNKTYHIAYTWGSRGIELWLNGTLVASDDTITSGLMSFTRNYGIGNLPMGSNTYSSFGYWDEFRVSNIQRSTFASEGDGFQYTEQTTSGNEMSQTDQSSDSTGTETNSFPASNFISQNIGLLLFIIIGGAGLALLSKYRKNVQIKKDFRVEQKYRPPPQNRTTVSKINLTSTLPEIRNSSEKQPLIDKFKSIMQMADGIEVNLLAQSLALTEEQLFEKLILWKEEVPFIINGKIISLNDVNSMITGLDLQFEEWDKKSFKKEGKI